MFQFSVAQNGRFVIYLVYLGVGTMVVKTLDFRLSKSLKIQFPGSFYSLKLPLEN